MTTLVNPLSAIDAALARIEEKTRPRPRLFGAVAGVALFVFWALFAALPSGRANPVTWVGILVVAPGIPSALWALWVAFDATAATRFWPVVATGLGAILSAAYWVSTLHTVGWTESMGDEAVRQLMIHHPTALLCYSSALTLASVLALIVLDAVIDAGERAWDRYRRVEVPE